MKKKSNLGSGICLLFGAIFLIAGWCVLTFLGKPMLADAKASQSWPVTPGKVTESRIKQHRGDKGQITFSADVVYEYTVEKKIIHGDNIWMMANYSSSSRKDHLRIIADFPVGKEVQVYYKPSDPFVSVLNPGTVWMSYFGIILGWLFFGIGSCFLIGVSIYHYLAKEKDADPEFESGTANLD